MWQVHLWIGSDILMNVNLHFRSSSSWCQLPWWKGAKLLSRPVWVGFWWTWNPHTVLDTLLEVEFACFQQTSGRDFIPWWKWSQHASSALHLRILYLHRSRAWMLSAHFWQGFDTLMEVEPTCSQRTSGTDFIPWWKWSPHAPSALLAQILYLDGSGPHMLPAHLSALCFR